MPRPTIPQGGVGAVGVRSAGCHQPQRDRFRSLFAPYYATPVYNQFLAWAGYRDAARQISEGWAEKDRSKTTGAITDDLVHQIAIIGSAEECRARILDAADAGIHTHIIAPMSADPAEIQATLNAFTPALFSF